MENKQNKYTYYTSYVERFIKKVYCYHHKYYSLLYLFL